MNAQLTGLTALAYAKHRGASNAVSLYRLADLTEGPRAVTFDAALAIAREDPSLIAADVDGTHVAHELQRLYGCFGPDSSGLVVSVSDVNYDGDVHVHVSGWIYGVVLDVARAVPVLALYKHGHALTPEGEREIIDTLTWAFALHDD